MTVAEQMKTIARAYDKVQQNGKFGFQIRFLKVGEKSTGGDAICIRWGYGLTTEHPDQFVMVVDSGAKKDGDEVAAFLKGKFKTNRIDLLVGSHCHDDHLGGIESLTKDFVVERFLVHCPWKDPELGKLLHRPPVFKWPDRDALNHYKVGQVYDLVASIGPEKVVQPEVKRLFSEKGVSITVLGPMCEDYRKMFAKFPDEETIGESHKDFAEKDFEAIVGGEDSDPRNATSIIIALTLHEVNDKVVLLTADATPEAQRNAIKNAWVLNVPLEKILGFQVPHHGSNRNSRKDTLDSFLGEIGVQRPNRFALASVPAEAGRGHPDEKVIAAIKNRGWEYMDRHTTGVVGLHNDGVS